MKNKIAYINFYKRSYLTTQEFYLEQNPTLSYKLELGKNHVVHYLLNNNLSLNEWHQSVYLTSKELSRLSFLSWVIQRVRSNKYNYIIIHGLDYFMEAAIIKWFSGSKIILQHHAEKIYLRKKAWLLSFGDKWVDGYFFNGKEVAQPFIQKRCISSINKIHEVVEGSSDFQLLPNKKISGIKQVVFIGRLNENKNLITLLKAIVVLKSKRTDFNVSVYYTSNELESKLKNYCQTNQLTDIVTFKGSVPKPKMEAILNYADIFISSSLYEGSGYSLIEALACGVFPIVSHIPAFDFLLEMLNEKEQFSALNEKALAEKIDKVLDINFTADTKEAIRTHFEKKCSNKAIALQIEKSLGF